jgi:DNA mismatch repair protein MutH
VEIKQKKNGEEFVYAVVDFSSPEEIESYAKNLEGMTFREVIELDIAPDGVSRDYGNKRYKGGMGTLIEERYFGYKANNDAEPDFPEAGVELKTTCYDVKKDGNPSAGERLVLTMIPFDRPIEDSLFESHVWEKSSKILLIYYERDKTVEGYDQVIKHALVFSPPSNDLKIIEDDYNKIRDFVQAGKAEELSESLTNYLGACTKGASEAKMWASQYYPPNTQAKRRAFCFKRQYMDYVLNHYLLGAASDSESIITEELTGEETSFEQYVQKKVAKYSGKTARELCEIFGIEYTKNKAQWTTLTNLILGTRGEQAEEFEKANISCRTVRVNESGGLKESLSLHTFEFTEIANGQWEESKLFEYLEETRFFFTVFRIRGDEEVLVGSSFWNMPISDLEGPVRDCWEEAKRTINNGVLWEEKIDKSGKLSISNDLPGSRDNPIAHVRPHASHRAYQYLDGRVIGNPEKDGSELPDGRWMTKQSFWLNGSYVYEIIQGSFAEDLD